MIDNPVICLKEREWGLLRRENIVIYLSLQLFRIFFVAVNILLDRIFGFKRKFNYPDGF